MIFENSAWTITRVKTEYNKVKSLAALSIELETIATRQALQHYMFKWSVTVSKVFPCLSLCWNIVQYILWNVIWSELMWINHEKIIRGRAITWLHNLIIEAIFKNEVITKYKVLLVEVLKFGVVLVNFTPFWLVSCTLSCVIVDIFFIDKCEFLLIKIIYKYTRLT